MFKIGFRVFKFLILLVAVSSISLNTAWADFNQYAALSGGAGLSAGTETATSFTVGGVILTTTVTTIYTGPDNTPAGTNAPVNVLTNFNQVDKEAMDNQNTPG